MDGKEIKIVFEPGCFDSFEGTQEELDEILSEIQRMVESGEIFEQTEMVDEEIPEWVMEALSGSTEDRKRKLN